MDDPLRGLHTTLSTSLISPAPTPFLPSEDAQQAMMQAFIAAQVAATAQREPVADDVVMQMQMMQQQQQQQGNESTINGVVIGLLSSFGSALLIALVFMIVYFFKYTSSGRILLDRIGRPGEYDDEQAFAREEAEALDEMDDLQRAEYLRAKGASELYQGTIDVCFWLTWLPSSIYPGKPTGLITYGHFFISVFSDPGERRISMGV
jgi:hypothetical protein